MDMKIKAGTLSLLVLLNGCATATKSTLLGAAIGGATGAGIGQANSHDAQGTMIGLAIGAGIGSLFGYIGHKDNERREAKTTKLSSQEEEIPFLTRPKIRSIVVPDMIEGNKYIKSHRVYILEDPGTWSKE